MEIRTYQKHDVSLAIRRLIDSIDAIYYRSRFTENDHFWLFTENLYCRLLSRDLENCNAYEEEL